MGAKTLIYSIGDSLGIFHAGRLLFSARHGTRYIRAVNYHITPANTADNFRRHLEFYARYFDNVTPADLDACLKGQRVAQKPGLLISFDDGCRSNYDFAAPLLEEFGFTGWFFVSTGRISASRPADAMRATIDPAEDFMCWAEIGELADRNHVVGCHTHSHVRLSDGLSAEQLDDEIVMSKARLEAGLGRTVDAFCWVGGEEGSYGAQAARTIRTANYRYAFMTNCEVACKGTNPLRIQRTNIEAHWPLSRVRFNLSGAMDLVYARKRKRIAARLSGA